MNKIGVTTGSKYTWGQKEDDFNRIKRWGYDCVNFDAFADVNCPLYTMSDKEYKEYALINVENQNKTGICIWQVHGPWPTDDTTPESRKLMIEYMLKGIERSSMLGCKNYIIHPQMPFGWSDKGHEEESYEGNKEMLKATLGACKEFGVTINIENMPAPDLEVGRVSALAKLIDEIGSEEIGICLDTGHALIDKEDIAETLGKYKDKIKTLHIHDNHGTSDNHFLPFMGVGDWKAFSEVFRTTDLVLMSEANLPFKFKGMEEMEDEAQKFVAGLFKKIAGEK